MYVELEKLQAQHMCRAQPQVANANASLKATIHVNPLRNTSTPTRRPNSKRK